MAERELMDAIMRTVVEELEKHVPEDVRKDLREIAHLQTEIQSSIKHCKILNHATVARYNQLCLKHFRDMQDREEPEEKQPKPKRKGVFIPGRNKPRICGECLLMDPGRNGDPDWCNLLGVPVDQYKLKDNCPLIEVKKIEEFKIL